MTPVMREQLLRQLTVQESYKPYLYFDCCGLPWRKCSCEKKGKLTGGIGRNFDDVPISKRLSEFMCDEDIDAAELALRTSYPWVATLDSIRYITLVNMMFNMGPGKLAGFKKFLAAMEAGDYETAALEMDNSLWARQTKTRYQQLRKQILTGKMV